jgi:cytoskeleton protein RodZ
MSKPKQPHLTFPEPVPDRAVPPGAVVFLVAVIGIGAYFLWYRHSEHELKLAQMVPAIPAKLAPLAVPKQQVPKSAAPAVPNANPDTAVASVPDETPTPTGDAPASTTPATSSPTPPSTSTTATTTPAPATPPASGATATVPNPNPAPATTAPALATTTTNPLVISATADSWVQVQGPTGTILFSRVLKAGETWPVPDEPGLTLTTGNAGGTVLIHNGVAGSPLGTAGSVMRKVPLTPAAATTTPASSSPASSSPASPSPAPTSPPAQ